MPTYQYIGVPVVVLTKVGTIELDMVDDVTVTEENLVTRHPVESGTSLSDNIVVLPTSIRLSGRFVDSPLVQLGLATTAAFNPTASIAAAAVGVAAGVASLLAGEVRGRSITMWRALEQLRKRKELVTVNVQQGSYLNMAIKNIVAPRAPGDGGSQRFQIELLEIITAFTLLSPDAIVVDDDIEHSAAPQNDLGTQSSPSF